MTVRTHPERLLDDEVSDLGGDGSTEEVLMLRLFSRHGESGGEEEEEEEGESRREGSEGGSWLEEAFLNYLQSFP